MSLGQLENSKVLIIVPAYNEAQRLPQERFLNELPKNVEVLFANDGSTDDTKILIDKLCQIKTGFYAYHGSLNRGKANVIHDAYCFFKQNIEKNEYDWVGFWDADLATPLVEIHKFLAYQNLFSSHSKALFGCRLGRYGAHIERSMLRHYLSRIFVTFTDFLLGVKAYDSQCGAKLFHKSVVDTALGKEFISRWVFDVEFILRLNPKDILEVPVFVWKDVPGSKIKIGREAFRVLRDLLKIRSQYQERISVYRLDK